MTKYKLYRKAERIFNLQKLKHNGVSFKENRDSLEKKLSVTTQIKFSQYENHLLDYSFRICDL